MSKKKTDTIKNLVIDSRLNKLEIYDTLFLEKQIIFVFLHFEIESLKNRHGIFSRYISCVKI